MEFSTFFPKNSHLYIYLYPLIKEAELNLYLRNSSVNTQHSTPDST